ncbi:Hypothetical protein W5S_0543 [Pectobacterium parmentieri]|uniref:Uncharacterized protein n=1 Tax=Pectobacterium parmentieri TaxID=1905730 RepID=A0A0H3HZ32_PECPM|nr:Hypothetical protein W5S_0543 [Pectobacterium parmentieri]
MEIVRKENHMNIIDVFFYKLENFINPRCYRKDFPLIITKRMKEIFI